MNDLNLMPQVESFNRSLSFKPVGTSKKRLDKLIACGQITFMVFTTYLNGDEAGTLTFWSLRNIICIYKSDIMTFARERGENNRERIFVWTEGER